MDKATQAMLAEVVRAARSEGKCVIFTEDQHKLVPILRAYGLRAKVTKEGIEVTK